tara:strand:- start:116 stop:319 length:204 start_codon:yes stop_codon:yes gene_type:complete
MERSAEREKFGFGETRGQKSKYLLELSGSTSWLPPAQAFPIINVPFTHQPARDQEGGEGNAPCIHQG